MVIPLALGLLLSLPERIPIYALVSGPQKLYVFFGLASAHVSDNSKSSLDLGCKSFENRGLASIP